MSCNDLDLHWSWAPSPGEALKLGRRKSQLWPGLGPSRDYKSQDRGLHINPGQGNEPMVCQSSIREPPQASHHPHSPGTPTPGIDCCPHHLPALPIDQYLAHWARQGQSLVRVNFSSWRADHTTREVSSSILPTLRPRTQFLPPPPGLYVKKGLPGISALPGEGSGGPDVRREGEKWGSRLPLPRSCLSPPHSPASSATKWQRTVKQSGPERGRPMAGAGGGPGAPGRRQGPLWKLSACPLAARALLRFIMGLLCLRLQPPQAAGRRWEGRGRERVQQLDSSGCCQGTEPGSG